MRRNWTMSVKCNWKTTGGARYISHVLYWINVCVLTFQASYEVHYFSATVYSRGLGFLHVIYESFDCDLTQCFDK